MEGEREIRDTRWIDLASGPARKHRAMIVAWDTFLYTSLQQIEVVNNMPNPGDSGYKPTTPHAILAAKRQLLANFVEAPEKLGNWINYLYKAGFDCSKINETRKIVRATLDEVTKWRKIRNVAAHHLDFTLEPDEIIALYDAIDCVSLTEINDVWDAILQLGDSASSLTSERI